MRKTAWALAALLLVPVAARANAPEADSPAFYAENDELRGYILEAIDRSPALRAAHAEWRAAMERVTMAGALDDPTLSYSYFAQSSDKRYGVGLMQEFPWFGTLKARKNAALAEADVALQRLHVVRSEIVFEVKRAYHEYAYLADNLRAAEAQAATLSYMEDIVRAQYALALVGEDDLLRTQIEQSTLQDYYASLQQLRPALAARLTAAIGRDVAEAPAWPQPMALPPPPPPAPVVLAQVRAANPQLTAAQHTIDSRKAGTALARKMGYPMLGIGLEFEKMKGMRGMPQTTALLNAADAGKRLFIAGEMDWIGAAMDVDMLARTPRELRSPDVKDDVMVTFTMSLPIWRQKVRAGIAEAKRMEEAAVHDRSQMALDMESEARMAIYNHEDAQRRLNLYDETLMPRAKQTYQNLQTRYAAAAGAGFLELIDATRTLLDFERERARALHDLHQAVAAIERLMGGPWDATSASSPISSRD